MVVPLLPILLLVLVVVLLSGLCVANQYERAVVFRLGRYQGTRIFGKSVEKARDG